MPRRKATPGITLLSDDAASADTTAKRRPRSRKPPAISAEAREQTRKLVEFLVALADEALVMVLTLPEEAKLSTGEPDFAPDDDEVFAIADPLTNIILRSSVGAKFAAYAAGNADAIALLFALGAYGMRIAPYVREQVAPRVSTPVHSAPQRSPSANGAKPEPVVFDGKAVNPAIWQGAQ